MPLRLYFHPLSSFSQKVLIALYENDMPFEPHIVHFGEEASRKEFFELWPIGKIPVLNDTARDWFVPETSIIIEYLAQHYPGPSELVPRDADRARQMRLRDRFFDLYVNVPMQKISQFLGHTSTRVTERTYARYSPSFMKDAAEALEF